MSVVPASAGNNLRTPACTPMFDVPAIVYDSSSLLSARVDNAAPILSTVCTPVYVQTAMTRPKPSVSPYDNMPVCLAPGQSSNSIVNSVAQPPSSLLFTDAGSGSVSVDSASGPSLVGPHEVTTQSGLNVSTVSQLASLASQPLFTQPEYTQPPPTTGLGLLQTQPLGCLGHQMSSLQSSMTAT